MGIRINAVKSVIFALAAMCSMGALAEGKIAVCDVAQAIFSSDIAKQRAQNLEASSNLPSLQAEGEGKVAKGKGLQKDWEANNLAWDDKKKADYQKNMEYLRADIELIQKKMQAEQNQINQQIFAEIRPIALEQLDALIKEEGVEILLKKESVLWSGPKMDLTNKLIDRINKSSGNPSPGNSPDQ